MTTLNIATYSQIVTVLSQLATNYTNIFIDYYNIFYNPEPMDVTIQYYTDSGELKTITIPNRAKDRSYILNGEGNPEGVVSAGQGALYQDLKNGNLYLKQQATLDQTGWNAVITAEDLSNFVVQGSGSPEGIEVQPKGVLYIDMTNAALYIKSTSTGNTGWELISADTSNLANKDLSNLSQEGESHFANPSLSNLDSVGQDVLDSKEVKSHKTLQLTAESTNTQYPSAKTVYDYVNTSVSSLANRDLSNLTQTGKNYFVGTSQVRDCVFSAPNGLLSLSSNIISLPAGTILLCANGIDQDFKTPINQKVEILETINITVNWNVAAKGIIFYGGNGLLTYSAERYFKQIEDPGQGPVPSSSLIWYNPNTNTYQISSNSGETWTPIVAAEIGRFTTDYSGSIDSFYPYHPMRVAMEDDILSAVADNFMIIGEPRATLDFNTLPENCIWLEGAAVSRTTYAELFNVYGTIYGSGDGSTTFNLPDCRNRVFWGSTSGGYITAGLPNITGSQYTADNGDVRGGGASYGATGAFSLSSSGQSWGYIAGASGNVLVGTSTLISFNASYSNNIYGKSSTVQPPAIKVRFYTRYQ